MIRIGVVSTAHMHADSYAAQLRGADEAKLVGVWDDDAARRAAKAAQYGTEDVAELDDLLSRCDAVMVCSENLWHRTLTERAAAAGKHVLCEKPLAITPDDAAAMVRACQAAGVHLATAFPCRFAPAFQQLKAAVENGEIGDVFAVRGTNQGKCPGGWFVQKELSGGGAVIDHTVHVADLLRLLLHDEAKEVHCEADNLLLHQDFDDMGISTITFERGAFATLDASWSRPQSFPTWGNVTMAVYGTHGVLEMDMFAQESALYSDKTMRVSYQNWGSNPDGGLTRTFIRLVQGDADAAAQIASGIDGLRAVEVVEAAYESARTHQPAAVRRRAL